MSENKKPLQSGTAKTATAKAPVKPVAKTAPKTVAKTAPKAAAKATVKPAAATATKPVAKAAENTPKAAPKIVARHTSKTAGRTPKTVAATETLRKSTTSLLAEESLNSETETAKVEIATVKTDETETATVEIAAIEPQASTPVQSEEAVTGTTAGTPIDGTVADEQNDTKPKAACEADSSNEEHLLVIRNLKKYFPIGHSLTKEHQKYLKAVDGVSFTLDYGKTVGIVGESGCGKTTMGRTILRLYDVDSGEIIFGGTHLEHLKGAKLRKHRPQFQMIFQDPYSSLSPRMTVGEIIGEAALVHKIVPKSQLKEYVIDIMQKCGLQPHYYERYPHEFSGGQRQRICIAKALALKPKLIICDEPVSALDVSIQAQVINLFKDLQEKEHLAYIFISHDLSVVEHISDNVGVMYLGNMVEYGTKKDLFANPMHPYTRALFSAIPIPDPDVRMNRIILGGDIPSPANPPKGCKFHTRCDRCMEICKEKEPAFKNYGNGHFVACHLYDQEKPEEN